MRPSLLQQGPAKFFPVLSIVRLRIDFSLKSGRPLDRPATLRERDSKIVTRFRFSRLDLERRL